mgnify:CR=1 FL=1
MKIVGQDDKSIENRTHEEKVKLAVEAGKLLPETIDKVEHYKATLRAEAGLLNTLTARQNKKFLKMFRQTTLVREQLEIVSLRNEILHKQKIYENYLGRKKKYEHFLDEMSLELQSNFETVLSEAREIKNNPRLLSSFASYDETAKNRKHTLQERVEFYLYLKNEIENDKTSKKRR